MSHEINITEFHPCLIVPPLPTTVVVVCRQGVDQIPPQPHSGWDYGVFKWDPTLPLAPELLEPTQHRAAYFMSRLSLSAQWDFREFQRQTRERLWAPEAALGRKRRYEFQQLLRALE